MATKKRRTTKVAKRRTRRRNPITDIIGTEWMPAHAVRICPDGRVEVLREKNPGKSGFGFMDVKGTFHKLETKIKRLTNRRRKR